MKKMWTFNILYCSIRKKLIKSQKVHFILYKNKYRYALLIDTFS